MHKMTGLAAVLAALITTAANGQSMKSMQLANDLGSVLAAEEPCGFTYDQDAISAWIDKNTDPSDMGFSSSLSAMTSGAEYQIKDMAKSALTAHCRAISRTAKHYGFIK